MIALRTNGEDVPDGTLSNYSPLLRQLLVSRGITTNESADSFLHPDYERDVHDPFLLKDMEKAVERLVLAIEHNEHVRVYSDFDADGIPAAVVMTDCFKKIGFSNYSVAIPHRNTEGFGLNEGAIADAIASGVRVLLTLDCGMGDAAHIALATRAGIDVIVTDHHLPNHTVPEAFAIVNPNQEGDEYPNKNLCGAGVAFKVVCALIDTFRKRSAERMHEIPVGWEKWLLDMVALATLSDMVPLVGENRALVVYGLVVLRKSRRPGLAALFSKVRIRQASLSEDDIVFMVTPRINAASRMDEPELAFRLLSTTDSVEAETLATHLDSINNERKGAVAQMSKEIYEKMGDVTSLTRSVVLVGNTHWRPGLLGLAATKVVEVYGRPAFVWGRGESSVIKGSCRSDGSVDVMTLMSEVREHLVEFGGHANSGGFSTTVEQLVTLPDALDAAYERLRRRASEGEGGSVVCDAELHISDVNAATCREVSLLSPFGMGNPKPLFLFNKVRITAISWFGKAKEHLRLSVSDESGKSTEAIRFFAADDATLALLTVDTAVRLVASLEESFFGRTKELRLRIVEITVIP